MAIPHLTSVTHSLRRSHSLDLRCGASYRLHWRHCRRATGRRSLSKMLLGNYACRLASPQLHASVLSFICMHTQPSNTHAYNRYVNPRFVPYAGQCQAHRSTPWAPPLWPHHDHQYKSPLTLSVDVDVDVDVDMGHLDVGTGL